VVPLAFVLAALAGRIDWDFMLLTSGVAAVWVVSFAAAYRVVPLPGRLRDGVIATGCGAVLLLHASVNPDATGRRVLDRYAVHNPSFRAAESIVRQSSEAPTFERFLRAYTGLTDVAVAPVSIDFVPQLTAADINPKPLVFILVIDSLRTDYLSPYNPAVTFTPRIAQFAVENAAFANAFTRYGGTGLAMPAMWAGSALAHKQYVLPFAPMNALEKVLDANGYLRILSVDHITAELWQPSAQTIELDRGRPEMEYEFCRTLEELESTLKSGVARTTPVFGHTRALNLHVASIRNGFVPPGKSYPRGFNAPYAWQVERMDACFGGFIDTLKGLGVYDRSLVVLTSDHGEMLGEDGRWGHSYHMFPEVVQVPLLVHLPVALQTADVDRQALTLSTDITPTVYAALGYHPVVTDDLMGRPLGGLTEREAGERRRGSYVLAASYGAVYAVVSHNGRRLYIADAVKGGDLAYRRNPDARWSAIEVAPGTRMINQQHIRRYVDDLSRRYRVNRRY
jgi:membrane-anchored protein YejM (alkaline phosphatase superfamily)